MEFSYFQYKEPGVMENKGPLYGVFAEYVVRTPENDRINSWHDLLASYRNNYVFIFSSDEVDRQGKDGSFRFAG